jgi:uncharacterized protein involved in exopolysaccharide biosynthesis
MSESKFSSMSPMFLLKVFFRRKEMVIIPAFIGLVIGICSGMLLPKKFVSSTVLMVEEGKTDNPLFNNLAVSSTVGQRLNTISESMLGWNSLVELVKRLNLDKDVKSPAQFEHLVLGIRRDMIINLRGQNIIALSYIGDTPEITQSIVRNVTEIFIERNKNIQDRETSDAIAFIEEQLKVYRGKIKSAEISQMKDELTQLLQDSTEKHPRVKELRELMTRQEEELRKENLEYTENLMIDSKTNNPIVLEIKEALENVEKDLDIKEFGDDAQQDYYKILLAEKIDKVMARDIGINQELYGRLLQRLETAKITQRLQASKEGTKYTVLDPPRIPLKPVKPNKALVALGGMIIGLMFGIGIVLAVEFLDKSFIDVEDANNFFDAALLGAISKIKTEISVRQEREKVAWMYSLIGIAGVGVIVVTKALAHFIN